MNIQTEECTMPFGPLLGLDYVHQFEKVASYFDYNPYGDQVYEKRLAALRNRSFNRSELAACIRGYMAKWPMTEQIERNLARLEDENSVVVVGGQQAGLLGGPLFTLHKVLTILQLAEEQREELGAPVVPVFWIAGEDHDLQEINHIYLPRRQGAQLDKLALESDRQHLHKRSVSRTPLPKEEMKELLELFFERQPETEFSVGWRDSVHRHMEEAETYVDFFAGIMHDCFGKDGLLLIDSAHPQLRKLEGNIFEQIIDRYDEVDVLVRKQVERVRRDGYEPQVALGDDPALLFVLEEGKRLLLEKCDGVFQSKNGSIRFTREELVHIARTQPERLSNNVITRPLMQESLLPTLAFVGGLGEISYWALYGPYFKELGLELPVIVPRISMTLVEKSVARTMAKYDVSWTDVFQGMDRFRKEWLEAQDEWQLDKVFAEARQHIKEVYDPVLQEVAQIEQNLSKLGRTNLDKIMEQVRFLEKRSKQALEARHETALRQLDRLEQQLIPHGVLQERMYSAMLFLNKHGNDLLDVLKEHHFPLNGKHHIVYLHAKS